MRRSPNAFFAILGVVLLTVVGTSAAQQAEAEAAAGFELRASWAPIQSSSHKRHETEAWKEVLQPKPARATASYPWQAFAALLPGDDAGAGDAWPVPFAALQPFLEQLHPRPREKSHMKRLAYPGAHAVLLEKTAERIDLLLRAHVELELVPGEIFFTVSQFEGRLLVDPQRQRVLGFSLAVPSRDTNYDVHIDDRANGRQLIDIGYVPELGVAGGELPAVDAAALAAARRALRQQFYAWERLEWLPLSEAIERGAAAKKPLHLITVFGQLDDESC